eukprot:g33191.t1
MTLIHSSNMTHATQLALQKDALDAGDVGSFQDFSIGDVVLWWILTLLQRHCWWKHLEDAHVDVKEPTISAIQKDGAVPLVLISPTNGNIFPTSTLSRPFSI